VSHAHGQGGCVSHGTEHVVGARDQQEREEAGAGTSGRQDRPRYRLRFAGYGVGIAVMLAEASMAVGELLGLLSGLT